MYEQSCEAPLSIFDAALPEHPARQLLLSSGLVGWPRVLVQHYHYSAVHTQVHTSALMEDTIIIPLYGTVKLSGKGVHPFQPQSVQPGEILIVPRYHSSEWQWTGTWDALHLYLAPTLLATVAVDTLGVNAIKAKLKAQLGVVDAFIYQLGLVLLAELQSSGLAGPHYVAALTQALALHLLRNHAIFYCGLHTMTTSLAPHILRSVFDYIQSHLAQRLTQAEVAAIAHLSPFHFARLFRQATGQSLHQYIIAQRIATAKRLLLAGRLTLAEIALEVGFTDQSHLTRHIKRHCGLTPKLFVQTHTNVQPDRTIIQEIEAEVS